MKDTKKMLIQAGIEEIKTYGLSEFSIRRISSRCDMSCAAPYRHFKNKDEFILEIFRDGRRKWCGIQSAILEKHTDPKETITELACAYIDYLLTRREYATIVYAGSDEKLTDEQRAEITAMSEESTKVVNDYCKKANMPEDTVVRKTFLIKSLMYCTAIMINNGYYTDRDKAIEQFRYIVNREFTLD